jgi:hypothetical protein
MQVKGKIVVQVCVGFLQCVTSASLFFNNVKK